MAKTLDLHSVATLEQAASFASDESEPGGGLGDFAEMLEEVRACYWCGGSSVRWLTLSASYAMRGGGYGGKRRVNCRSVGMCTSCAQRMRDDKEEAMRMARYAVARIAEEGREYAVRERRRQALEGQPDPLDPVREFLKRSRS